MYPEEPNHNTNNDSEEMEKVKNKFKNAISTLINNGKLEEAKKLISEYALIVDKDVEIYSMNAIIAILENRFNDAEDILNEGLKIDNSNADLLLNMSYLMDINNKSKDSLEYFCKAKLLNPKSKVKINEIISQVKSIDNNSLRIIHGSIEIANQMNTMARGLRKLGFKATTVDYYPNYLASKSDYTLNVQSFNDINKANIQTKNLASKIIGENDVFHFHYGSTLTLDYSDLYLLKELGKKVIMQHWGSDVRLYSKAVKNSPHVKLVQPDENRMKMELDFLSRHISHCAVCDYELYEYVKDYYSNIYLIPQCVDLENLKVQNNKNNKLLIVHAPTNREIKGTEYILKAINDLQLKYDFDFKLIEKMSHEEAMLTYKRADIVIDQLRIGTYGLVSIENMALGKPVISYINEYMLEKYPIELPIITSGVENIKEKIEYLIKNQDILPDIGLKGRRYVEKYHDINKVNLDILEIYKKI